MVIFFFVISLICSHTSDCGILSESISETPEKQVRENYNRIARLCPQTAVEIPCIYPVRDFNGGVSSRYGIRKHPIEDGFKMHNGIDLRAEKNSEVMTTANGVVTQTGYDGNLGQYVTILHPTGYETVYGHLNYVIVNSNDSVKLGQTIGTVGMTGKATGYHVHYTVKKEGLRIDPEKYLLLFYYAANYEE